MTAVAAVMRSNGTPKVADLMRRYGELATVTVMLAVFNSVYVVAGAEPSTPTQLIASYTMPICFVRWVQADARARRCTPCFDFGTFVLVTWVFSVPWYLIWTRGWRGLLVTFMFVGLLVFPTFVAVVLWIVLAIAGA